MRPKECVSGINAQSGKSSIGRVRGLVQRIPKAVALLVLPILAVLGGGTSATGCTVAHAQESGGCVTAAEAHAARLAASAAHRERLQGCMAIQAPFPRTECAIASLETYNEEIAAIPPECPRQLQEGELDLSELERPPQSPPDSDPGEPAEEDPLRPEWGWGEEADPDLAPDVLTARLLEECIAIDGGVTCDPSVVQAYFQEQLDRATAIEVIHTTLDLCGMAPALGSGCDAVNATIYVFEGDYTNAWISVAGAVLPVAGDALKAGRLAVKVGNKSIVASALSIRQPPRVASAEAVNNLYTAAGRQPPYAPGKPVWEMQMAENQRFVRLHADPDLAKAMPNTYSRTEGRWLMSESEFRTLQQQYPDPVELGRVLQDRFALPRAPTHVSTVDVPTGTTLRAGEAGPQTWEVFDPWSQSAEQIQTAGGGVQFELIGQWSEQWFQNTRKFGEPLW